MIDVKQAGVNGHLQAGEQDDLGHYRWRAAPHDHLVGLGIDSLNLLELSRKLQHVFDAQGLDLFLVGNPSVTSSAYRRGGADDRP